MNEADKLKRCSHCFKLDILTEGLCCYCFRKMRKDYKDFYDN